MLAGGSSARQDTRTGAAVVYDPARMRLRALAAGIAAVLWGSGWAAASPQPSLSPWSSPPCVTPSEDVLRLKSVPSFATRPGMNTPPRSASATEDEPILESPSGEDVAREIAIAGALTGAGFLLDPVVKPGSNNGTFAFK